MACIQLESSNQAAERHSAIIDVGPTVHRLPGQVTYGLLPASPGNASHSHDLGSLPASASAPPQNAVEVPSTTADSSDGKTPGCLIKLQPYNGSGSLETFLAKFHCMACYLQFDREDTYYHLCASLEGATDQVMWDAGMQATTDDIIRLLQIRFGTELQARFQGWASRPLQGDRRTPPTPLSVTFLALAYPLADAPLMTYVGREAFVAALNDKHLLLEVMKREPHTIEEALSHAIKMEAYEQYLILQPDSDVKGGGWSLQAMTVHCLLCHRPTRRR